MVFIAEVMDLCKYKFKSINEGEFFKVLLFCVL